MRRRLVIGASRVLLVASALVAFVLAAVVLIAGTVVAEEPRTAKKYPPYPDVWGYEFPYPEPGNRRAFIDMFASDSGEVYVITARAIHKSRREDGTCCDLVFERELFEFFSGQQTPLPQDRYAKFLAENGARRIENWPLGQRYVLKGQGSVQARYRAHDRCFVHDPVQIVTRDRDGAVVRDVHLLYIRDDARQARQDPYCETANGASSVDVRVEHLWPRVLGLADGTFLLADSTGNIVVRFDLHFQTKFKGVRLFVVDTATFRRVVRDALSPRFDDQDVQDALADFLRTLPRKE